MTDTQKLQGKMRGKGFTIKSLAIRIGLSSTGLFNKIHNKKEFLASEVQIISHLLDLDDKEMRNIFFAVDVE